jgi:hypothetical protein
LAEEARAKTKSRTRSDTLVAWLLFKRLTDPQALGNEVNVACPLCDQTFVLCYTDNEWNKLNEWHRLANAALRNSHKQRHEEFPLELSWKSKHRR